MTEAEAETALFKALENLISAIEEIAAVTYTLDPGMVASNARVTEALRLARELILGIKAGADAPPG